MPTHWYYKRDLLRRDYGIVDSYQAPKSPHPDSILWRSQYIATGDKDDILHDQAKYWGQKGIHYHQNLKAGENTLNLKLAGILAESLIEHTGYNANDYAERYITFMLSPEAHSDTYVEEAHRAFFKNYARGKKPEKCGIDDNHIGGLSTLTPLLLFYHKDLEQMLYYVHQHLRLTHRGTPVTKAAELYAKAMYYSLKGETLAHALFESIGRSHYQALSHPYQRWIEDLADEAVIGRVVSSACYLEDAVPASLYLALKYKNAFRTGLIQNVILGGDNCHRGVVLGSLLGAQGENISIPKEWIEELTDYARYKSLSEQLWTLAG